MSWFKRVGVFLGKSGTSILRRDDEPFRGEVVDAMLPRKASKLQVYRAVP